MLNPNMSLIEKENTFTLVNKKIAAYKKKHPNNKVIALSIGDVSKPVCKPVLDAMHKAVDDLGKMETFQGYGLYYGLPSLRKLIIENDYKKYHFTIDEVYIGDGTKTDVTGILELFDIKSKVLVSDPMYPIYKNGCHAMSRNVECMKLDENCKPVIPSKHFDLIYICSPSNPTGSTLNKKDLTAWVKYAIKNKAVILYDNVYESFVHTKGNVKSVYDIPGAKKCVIEFRSFSKKASFTGLRCSYFVIPNQIAKGINDIYKERTLNRFNGASYVAQKGAEATFTKEAKKIIKDNMNYYLANAKYMKKEFEKLGFKVIGGIDAPYLWIYTEEDSWKFFDKCLNKMEVVIMPGAVFGKNSSHYFRVSALASSEVCHEAIRRFKEYYEK